MNFEDMADQLAAHPDYKVKRRLIPILNFGPGTGGPTKRILVLDTETTGLVPKDESIIELAMLAVDVDMQTGQPVGEVEIYEDFEDPGRPIPAEITKLTGISSQDVKGQKLNEAKIKDMVDQAIREQVSHRDVGMVGAHFLKFCGRYELNKLSDHAEAIGKWLNITYKGVLDDRS